MSIKDQLRATSMATLKIAAFLSISSASIDLRRFTVFIGPQAQGKSLILKLINFFEGVLNRAVIDVVSLEVTVAQLKAESLEKFESYFPRYTWGTDAFAINFTHGDFAIDIVRTGGRKNSPAKLSFSPSLIEMLSLHSATYKHLMESATATAAGRVIQRRGTLEKVLEEVPEVQSFLSEPMFIPASRSFFANIEKNIFTLMSNKFDLDPLMIEFGSVLSRTRQGLLYISYAGSNRRKKAPEFRRSSWKHIIHGDYVFNGDEELIESSGRMVRIANSSSGQQEAIPLLLVLDTPRSPVSIVATRRAQFGSSFFVEEPEAHLFPQAQKAIAAVLTEVMNKNSRNRVVFTTHSPYMLAAVNNLHLAGQLYATLPEDAHKAIEEVAMQDQTIGVDELAAYRVDQGHVISILDRETDLVNALSIDEVSIDFAADFNKLLELADAA